MSIFNYREQPGYFSRLKSALQSTREDLNFKINQLAGTSESPITEEQLEQLEELLIGADLGVQTTMEIVERLREETRSNRFVTSHQIQRLIRSELLEILAASDGWSPEGSRTLRPHVILVVGVNGVGKTTTIGKLAHLFQAEGASVLLSASDTFRAAAVEQLDIWANRTGCEIIKQKPGADPAAVLFDAIRAARARNREVLMVDTAGRLHSKSNLMQELEKMRRIASREVEGAPHEVYLILDATTGQNGLAQAREFLKASGVTGLIVTKLDGTAKGGIVVAIVKELKIPIRYIGVGEKKEDLLPFDPEAFVDSIFGESAA
jgi:fused signal recognition particle receptor